MSCSHAFLPGLILLVLIHANAVGQKAAVPESDSREDSIEIPVEKVWFNRIPGTRDIFELEPKVPPYLMKLPRDRRSDRHLGGTLTQQIDQRLNPGRAQEWSENNNEYLPPLKMFAVPGHGRGSRWGQTLFSVCETKQETGNETGTGLLLQTVAAEI